MFVSWINNNRTHILASLLFLLVSVLYFLPQTQGRKMSQQDIYQSRGRTAEAYEYYAQTGEQALWTNAVYGGMPTYQVGLIPKKNVFRYVQNALKLWINRPIGTFFFGCMTAYVMLICLGVPLWVAVVGSLSFSFSTNYLLLFEAGHNAKLMAIFSAPLIIAGLYSLFRDFLIRGSVLLLLGLGLNILANHYQMTYYLVLFLFAYFLFEAIPLIRKKEYPKLIRISVICFLACVVSLGTSATRFLTTLEYTKESTRGKTIVNLANQTPNEEENEQTKSGLAWDYSMQFSNGFLDVLSTFIPRIVGGSVTEKVKKNSAIVKEFNNRLNLTFQGEASYYWGSMPFVVGPPYMGVITVFLCLLSLLVLPGRLKWFLLGIVVISIFMSMGKHFSVLNRMLFDYFPMYNKFRSPNSILVVTNIFVVLLAFIGLGEVSKGQIDKQLLLKRMKWLVGAFAVLCIYYMLIGYGLHDLSREQDAGAYVGYGMEDSSYMFIRDRISILRLSCLRSLVLVLLGASVIWLFIKGKVNQLAMIAIIGGLILVDQISIGQNYMGHDDFTESVSFDYTPQASQADRYIMDDEDLYFRVFDRTDNTFSSNRASFFHKSIGGYHAAKLRRFDDVINRYLKTGGNRAIENMLNVKYYIQPGESGQPEPFRNRRSLGNAWISNSIEIVGSDEAELNRMSDFTAFHTTLVHREFSEYVKGIEPTGRGLVKLESYSPNELVYSSKLLSNELVVFSEIWYGPQGWHAYIDGEKVDHIRANYLLRALKVPSGEHEIRFSFEPNSYKLGEIISVVSSLLVVLFFIFFFYSNWNNFQRIKQERKQKIIAKKEEMKLKSSNKAGRSTSSKKRKNVKAKKPKK